MQTSLFPMKTELKFGGEMLLGKRKGRRPLCTKRPIHLVLRAKQHQLKLNEAVVRSEIARAAKRWGIRIYQWAIVSDHIHLHQVRGRGATKLRPWYSNAIS